MACMLEVTAPKPGNVHRGADFEDVTFSDFLISGIAIGEVFDRPVRSVGQYVLQAVKQTKEFVGTNTNLGIVLLISPLVVAARIGAARGQQQLTSQQVAKCLQATGASDGRAVFEAIAMAEPGGLGKAPIFDVNSNPDEIDLMAAMKLASDRDSIAKQYVSGLADVFGIGQRLLSQGRILFKDLNSAIVFCHVAWMAHQPDSLIQRKLGLPAAQQAQQMAQKTIEKVTASQAYRDVLEGKQSRLDETSAELFWRSVADLDFWLRSDGHRRNPGTTADLIAASLFVAIYNGTLSEPFNASVVG